MKNIEKVVEDLIERQGYWMLNFSVTNLKSRQKIVVTIDHEGFKRPVGLEDCVRISRAIDAEVESLMGDQPYDLEVTSPGSRRPLRSLSHRQSVIGQEIGLEFPELRTLNDKKVRKLSGKLLETDEHSVTVEIPSGEKLKLELEGNEKVFSKQEFVIK